MWCVLLLVFPWQVFAADDDSFLALGMAYRLDALDWNINGAGNPTGSEPNILSELEWRDLDIMQLKAELIGSNATGFYFRGLAAYGWVLDGENQDSDYAGDNRSLEFSRSLSDTDGSTVLDVSGGLGYTFFLGENDDIRFIPIVGYSYHQQRLRMRNGNQKVWSTANALIYDPDTVGGPALGPFSGLNASYDSNWSGPWLGFDMQMDLQDSSMLFERVEGHLASYYGKANWNLRDDFAHPVSFEHEANGRGWVLELGWRDQPSRHYWTWGVTASLQSWTTDAGIDRTFFVDPAPPCNGNCYSESGLNEVNWSSRSINVTLSKAFSD